MNRRKHLAIVLGLVTLLGIGQALWRSRPAPKPAEIIDWEPLSALGDPPWNSMVLLDFTADWCPPCRRMQVTTFRDPAFKRFLEVAGLRPVRIEHAPGTREEFEEVAARYGVRSLPTLVLLDETGRELGRLRGRASTSKIEGWLETRWYWATKRVNWIDVQALDQSGDKLPVILFNQWKYLDPDLRSMWLWYPAPEFAQWANRYLLPARARYGRHMTGVAEYRRYGVNRAPTLIALGRDGEEIARFEGEIEVGTAPAELARIAREHGYEMPDPPQPTGH